MSSLRQRVVNFLYDFNATIKIKDNYNENITLLSMVDKDFKAKNDKFYKWSYLKKYLVLLLKDNPKVVLVFLSHQDFDYESEGMLDFKEFVSYHKKIFVGLYDLFSVNEDKKEVPKFLNEEDSFFFDASFHKTYRQEVVRKFHLYSFLNQRKKPVLLNKVSSFLLSQESQIQKKRPQFKINNDKIFINYSDPRFIKIHLLDEIKDNSQLIRDKIILLGVDSFRKRTIKYRDGSLSNTPWQGDNNSEKNGVSNLLLYSIILNNLLSKTWLYYTSNIFTFFQTIFLLILSVFFWRQRAIIACLLLFFMIFFLFILNSFLMSFFSVSLQFADSFFFILIVSIICAFVKAKNENLKNHLIYQKKNAQLELLRIQNIFLNRTIFKLFSTSSKVHSLLLQMEVSKYNNQENIRKIRKSAIQSTQDLIEYLSGIKSYLELSEKTHHVSFSRINMNKLIEKIIRKFDTEIDRKNICISLNIRCEIVESDEILLEMILFNIISNAIKYSPEGANVFVSCESAKEKKILISVRDEGPGIAEDFRDKIFEKFYRIKDSSVYQMKGNGLGLYLCKHFADKLNISIKVVNHLKKGSVFEILIPQ